MRSAPLFALGALVLSLASCGGAERIGIRERSGDGCSQGGPAIPLRSFGNEPQAFRVVRAAAEGPKRYTYRFEREPSGTTETLRAVFMEYEGRVLAVGDRGTALVRDPAKGWMREETGTEANLHALVRAPFRPEGPVDQEREKRAPWIVVGAHGTALARSVDGVWHAEQTGTDKDLFAVWHRGTSTVAVGAGGIMVQRSPEGVWRPVRTRTTADLYGIGNGNAVGAGGLVVECRWLEGEPVCIPRSPLVERDLHAVSDDGYYFGDGVLLAPRKNPDETWSAKPWGDGKGDPIPAEDHMRAVWKNRFSEMGEHIAVGRAGAVWFISNPYYRKNTFERVQLPFGVDLHGVAFELVDGFLVGDRGTIVHLAVDGITVPTICLL